MNETSPLSETLTDKLCKSCRHMRARNLKDNRAETGYVNALHWCAKNDMPTLPQALRCGGSDWEAIPAAQERQNAEANLKHELFELEKHHGTGAATLWLVGELVRIQKQGTIRKADYQGDGFRVTVTVKQCGR
jgi:hypothetical protein